MDNNIETFNKNMTVFYSKTTKEVRAISGGIQDFEFFGINKDDYSIIYDKVVVEYDSYAIRNMTLFKIENGDLKLIDKEMLNKYI